LRTNLTLRFMITHRLIRKKRLIIKFWIRFIYLLSLRLGKGGLYELFVVFVSILLNLKASIVFRLFDIMFNDRYFFTVEVYIWSKFYDSPIFSVVHIHEYIEFTAATNLYQLLNKASLTLVKCDIAEIPIGNWLNILQICVNHS
jgi:hypothetical protein